MKRVWLLVLTVLSMATFVACDKAENQRTTDNKDTTASKITK